MQDFVAEKVVSWKDELMSMVASASSETDKLALLAFQSALMPYLENPAALRTMLGKIQMLQEFNSLTRKEGFPSFEALQSELPETIKVVAA